MPDNANTGASAAFKGFRTQTLFILNRILCAKSEHIFYPEGAEDLLIKTQNGDIVEVIQVKNYTSKFSLSHISPHKKESFFRRSISDYYNKGIELQLTLVSFGDLSQEFISLKDSKVSSSIRQKLIQKKYSSEEVDWLFKNLKINTVKELEIFDSITKILSNSITGFSPVIAFDLLMQWLYEISEKKEYVDKNKLVSRIEEIGVFFGQRKAFLEEFGTTILPLDIVPSKNKEVLAKEFYQGISTRYEHITQGFDVIRKQKIKELKRLFQSNKVVVIQGASGQGKSTLAYRYLHSFKEDHRPFRIQQNFSISSIYKIQSALKLLVEKYEFPIKVLVDVPPNEIENWTILVKSLIDIENVKVLVTIRAEDFNRSENIGEITRVGDLLLDLTKIEAHSIYKNLSIIRADFQFTNFEEAWLNFGEKGSLLEFVYLITQGESLKIRLKNQIKRIEDRWEKDKLNLLKIIAILHRYECTIITKNLKTIASSPKLKIFIDELQNEYFLRTSIDNKLLIGLHPIRSKIISELLIDPEFDDVEKLACDGLKVVDENDLNKLLLNYFYDSSELNDFLKELDNYTIKNWQTVENILRSLFWLGIKEFAALNMELIKEFKEEFHTTIFLLIDDFGIDLSGIKKINETRVNKIESQIKRLQGKDLVYEKARKWLSTFKPPSLLNLSEEDWNGLAYTLFWMHRFQIEKNLNFSQLSGIDKLELTQLNSFANILLSLNLFSKESKVVYNSYLPSFIDQIKVDYRIVSLQQDNTSVKANYIFDVETKNQESTKNYIHQKSVDIANLLRKAFPEKEFYSTQGYGHKLLILPDQNDDSIKQ